MTITYLFIRNILPIMLSPLARYIFDVNHYPYFFRHTHQPALISRLEVKRSINTLSTSVFGTPQVSPISNITLKYNDVSLFMQNRFPIQNVGFCLKTNIF